MSKLKFKKREIRCLSENDLDAFIQKHTPFKKYCFISDVEASNDSCVEIEVDPTRLDDGEYYADELEDHWNNPDKSHYGEFNFKCCESILARLCKEGKVEAGKYLVEVCW